MALGGAGPRLPAPGIRSRATSMLADAVHRQARPGIRRWCHRISESRHSVRRLVLAVAVALALVPDAAVGAVETSAGVSVVASIPDRGVISAKAVGQYLYVSSLTGVTIYDISVPRAPVRMGGLALPNAQNEDVDVGSG